MNEIQKKFSEGFISLFDDLILLNQSREIVLQCIEDVTNYAFSHFKQNKVYKRVSKAIAIMEEKFHLSLKMSDIAREVSMIEKALMRLFFKTTVLN